MHTAPYEMPVMAPLGKPKRKTTEPAPIEVPDDWPVTVPVEPPTPRVPVPA